MILIVAPEDDLHARIVGERLLERGRKFLIWDSTWFPWRNRVSWRPDGNHVFSGLADFSVEQIDVVWWRRFRRPTVDPAIGDDNVKKFCGSESLGLLRSIFDFDVPIVNQPWAERRAASKPHQLRLAKSLGLRIPRTLISNDREEIVRFLEREKGEAIFKMLSNSFPHAIPTKRCTLQDFEDPQRVAMAPSLVQELIPCQADIRVCIVADEVFAAELRREDADIQLDWRRTPGGWEPHRLPAPLSERLRLLLQRLELSTGSIDLRLTPEGEYCFFEVNATGQFLFLEINAGLPLSAAFADLLMAEAAKTRVR